MHDKMIFDRRRGKARLPRVLRKVCTHNGGPNLDRRFRGDMSFDVETFAGIREEIYCCIQCGFSANAKQLWGKMQAYVLLGSDFSIGRRNSK